MGESNKIETDDDSGNVIDTKDLNNHDRVIINLVNDAPNFILIADS